jgi:hypothetical protein
VRPPEVHESPARGIQQLVPANDWETWAPRCRCVEGADSREVRDTGAGIAPCRAAAAPEPASPAAVSACAREAGVAIDPW